MRWDSRPQALLACAALLSLAGCASSGWGLPSRKTADTPFRSFEGVKDAYEEVVPGVSQTDDLIALRFDPQTNSSGFRLPFVAILHLFQPRPGMLLDQQPPEISGCLALRERCEVWAFELKRGRRHRMGNFFLDVLRFKRHHRREGWKFSAIFLLVDGTVVYKTWRGTPQTLTERIDVRPLGRAQNFFR